MKIRTLTSHNVYNYGASLQAFALMKYLKKKGNEVEIIDYMPEYRKGRYNFWFIDPRFKWRKYKLLRLCACILLFPKRFYTYKRKASFDTFTKNYLSLTDRYESLKELENVKWNADLFIVGSDQVWNSYHETGKDPANYLSFVPEGIRKVSYAASFGTDRIKEGFENIVKDNLKSFSFISVREKQGVDILRKLGFKAVLNLDPVFLLDRDEWDELESKNGHDEKYILVYDFANNEMIKNFAIEYSRKHSLKIYSLNDFVPHRYADKNINNAGPREFLNLIKNAECFVSNSFHGTAFSIIFNKQFFVFNRKDAVNSRMQSLLSLIGLEDRIVNNYTEFSKMDNVINYDGVNTKLQSERKHSEEVFLKVLAI